MAKEHGALRPRIRLHCLTSLGRQVLGTGASIRRIDLRCARTVSDCWRRRGYGRSACARLVGTPSRVGGAPDPTRKASKRPRGKCNRRTRNGGVRRVRAEGRSLLEPPTAGVGHTKRRDGAASTDAANDGWADQPRQPHWQPVPDADHPIVLAPSVRRSPALPRRLYIIVTRSLAELLWLLRYVGRAASGPVARSASQSTGVATLVRQ